MFDCAAEEMTRAVTISELRIALNVLAGIDNIWNFVHYVTVLFVPHRKRAAFPL
jgi:hypothetical protein